MMQLLCNGERLDLPIGASLQFTHANPLFAFDSMACERTTSFSLPATPTNDRLLALSRVPAYDGAGMRARFAAQLVDGAVVKNGFLYVTEWNGKEYNAIFLTGEMLGLKAIKEAGKVADLLAGSALVYQKWGAASTIPTRPFFWTWKYTQKYGGANYVPAINLAALIQAAANAGNIPVAPTSGSLYMICKEPKAPYGELSVSMTGGSWGNWDTQADISTLTLNNSPSISGILGIMKAKIRYMATRTPNYMYGYMNQLVCLDNDIQLTFPDDLDSEWVCMSFPTNCAEFPSDDPEIYKPGGAELPETLGVFLGDYSFRTGISDNELIYSGEPLAGRTIDIPKGTPFILLYPPSMFDFYPQGAVGWYSMYWSDPIMYNVPERKAVLGDKIALIDNLPDVTLVELMKTYAALSGKVLNYDVQNGQTYDTLNFATWAVKDYTKWLLERKNVARSFADYAQSNIVNFKGDDTQLDSDHITRAYNITNVNIEAEKVLQTIPMSEGSVNVPSTLLYLRNTAEDIAPKEFVLGVVNADGILERVTLPQIVGLQTLCTASTQYKVQVRMALTEYNTITAKTLLMIDGMKYAWTERQWQKDIATFTLAKI